MNRRLATAAPLVLLALAFTTGCIGSSFAGWGMGLQGSGKKASETRTVGSFSRVTVAGSVDTEVKVGTPQSVVVEGDDNLLAIVTTEVKGDALTISAEQSYSSRVGLKVRIVVPRLDGLEIAGSGDSTIEGFKGEAFKVRVAGSGDVTARGTADRIEVSVQGSGNVTISELVSKQVKVSIHGSGDVRLRGSADAVTVSVHGSGDVNAADLKSRQASVEVYGSGDVQVNAAESIDARIEGSGDVTYSGNPAQVNKSGNGSGDVIKR